MKSGVPPRPIADRFWPKVQKAAPDDCWLWTASVGSHGYGQLSMPGSRPECAHRIAWTLTNGPIPDGLFVLHKCDVRRCCNPAHMFLGTNAENMADMHRKGRGVVPAPRYGADHPRSKARQHARGESHVH